MPQLILEEISASLNKKNISIARILVYSTAFVIRILIAAIFVDKNDILCFSDTAADLVVYHRPLYYEGSHQVLFNYFPIAYLAAIPGIAIYYWLRLNNPVLQRIFLKLPFIFTEIALALLFSKKFYNNDKDYGSTLGDFTLTELCVLFNPLIIYAGSFKGQFDAIPALLALVAYRLFLRKKDFFAGLIASSAFLLKLYNVVVMAYIGWFLLLNNWKRVAAFATGALTTIGLVIGFGALIGFNRMIAHAILYHVDRPPSGPSVTSSIYHTWMTLGYGRISAPTLETVGNIEVESLFVVMVAFQIYFLFKTYKEKPKAENLLKYVLLGYVSFFLFNKVLWLHYLVAPTVFWYEKRRLEEKPISLTELGWTISLVPLMLTHRLIRQFTPLDIKSLLGNNWPYILFFSLLFIHFILVIGFMRIGKINLFISKKLRYSYIILIVFVCFLFVLHLFLEGIIATNSFSPT